MAASDHSLFHGSPCDSVWRKACSRTCKGVAAREGTQECLTLLSIDLSSVDDIKVDIRSDRADDGRKTIDGAVGGSPLGTSHPKDARRSTIGQAVHARFDHFLV